MSEQTGGLFPRLEVDPICRQLRRERMRRRRKEGLRGHRWTQEWVGEQLAVTQATVCQWEQGRNIPRLPQLRAWAALFDLDLALVAIASEMVA